MKRSLVCILLFLFTSTGINQAAPIAAPVTQEQGLISPYLGITFISSAEHQPDEQRYRQARLLGAGWNRWPLYWNQIEREPGTLDFSLYDRVVSEDLRHDLQINAILLGRPPFQEDGGSIKGLASPVFSDGTDDPAPGKVINPGNPWASFVYTAVNRYRPGGVLAQAQGWPPGRGITVWEAWNEPDFSFFWAGSVEDYARLLKVTYLAAHHADPQARVMFGGLAFSEANKMDWLQRVLDIYTQDAQAAAYNFYFDLVAVHNYSNPLRSGWLVDSVQDTLRRYRLERPVWLNESGAPIWDDYPGPVWASSASERVYRTTLDEQAAFFVQSTAFAWASGAEVVFFHQLYDDCGNQPAGTTFPLHNGELCIEGFQCWGDAFGLYRNPSSATCFNQHPLPGTPRPSAIAFRLMAQLLGDGDFENPMVRVSETGTMTISFDRPSARQRISIAWNRRAAAQTLEIAASGVNGTVYSLDNDNFIVVPTNGVYAIELPGALSDSSQIGGNPMFIVERIEPMSTIVSESQDTPLTPIVTTPGSVVTIPRPTIDPALDTTPPNASVLPLPVISPATFTVNWQGQDNSGIGHYLVWVSVNGGEWQPWQETNERSAVFTGQPGNTYEFAVWAVDLAGNWSQNTELTSQAATRVE